MSKITKGFIATKDGHLVRVTVSVAEMGFYILVEVAGEQPRQQFRAVVYRAKLLVNSYRDIYNKKGYMIKELGDHNLWLNNGQYKPKL